MGKHGGFEVSIVCDTGVPISWAVEAIDSDGGIEVASFSGPNAEVRARDYCGQRYGTCWPEMMVTP